MADESVMDLVRALHRRRLRVRFGHASCGMTGRRVPEAPAAVIEHRQNRRRALLAEMRWRRPQGGANLLGILPDTSADEETIMSGISPELDRVALEARELDLRLAEAVANAQRQRQESPIFGPAWRSNHPAVLESRRKGLLNAGAGAVPGLRRGASTGATAGGRRDRDQPLTNLRPRDDLAWRTGSPRAERHRRQGPRDTERDHPPTEKGSQRAPEYPGSAGRASVAPRPRSSPRSSAFGAFFTKQKYLSL